EQPAPGGEVAPKNKPRMPKILKRKEIDPAQSANELLAFLENGLDSRIKTLEDEGTGVTATKTTVENGGRKYNFFYDGEQVFFFFMRLDSSLGKGTTAYSYGRFEPFSGGGINGFASVEWDLENEREVVDVLNFSLINRISTGSSKLKLTHEEF